MDQLENDSLVSGDSQTSSSGITDIGLDEQIQNDPCINSAFDLGENASSQVEIAYNQLKQNVNMLPVLSPSNPKDFIIPMLSPEEREIRQRQIQEKMRHIDLQIQSILQNTCNNPVGIPPGFNCGCPMQPNVCNYATSGNLVENTLSIPKVPNSTREIVRRQIQSRSQFQHQKEENESQLVTQDRSHEHEIKLSPTETELQKSTNHCDTEIPQQRSIPAKRKHVCPECNKCFNQTCNFKMHMQIHYGIKQFKCLECGKLFRQKAHLLKHVEVHNRKRGSREVFYVKFEGAECGLEEPVFC